MNITYEIKRQAVVIDDNPTGHVFNVPSGVSNSVTANINLKSFQRDELYRFGIVMFDKKFKPSFVKHIADIKIPDWPLGSAPGEVDNIVIEFTVTELPTEAMYYQIVYVPRTAENRSVIDMGFFKTLKNGSVLDQFNSAFDYAWVGNVSSSVHASAEYAEYTSPEILYNNLEEAGARLENVSIISWERENIHTNENPINIVKFKIPTSTIPITSRLPITEFKKHNFVSSTVQAIPFRDRTIRSALELGEKRAIKGSTGLLYIEGGIPAGWTGNPEQNAIVRRRKNLSGNQYGPLEFNTFIGCSPVMSRDESSTTATGDVFIRYFEFLRGIYPQTSNGDTRLGQTISIPVETTINLNLITNPTFNSLLPVTHVSDTEYVYRWMQEIKGVYGNRDDGGGDEDYYQDFDLYTYNTVYSRKTDVREYTVRPATLRTDNTIDTRVYVSLRKNNVELEDSWLVFRNFLDLDTGFGQLTRLINFKNNLYSFQSKAVSVLSVDQRELNATDAASALTVGIGGVLDRYDYIYTNSGTDRYDSVAFSKAGLYYVDNLNKAICRVGQVPEFLSDISFKSWVKNKEFGNAKTAYNSKFNTLFFSIDNENILVFNESIQKFTEFFTSKPELLVQYNNTPLAFANSALYIYSDFTKGTFEDASNNSKINFVIKPEGRYIQRLDIIELLTNVLDTTDVELEETISTFRVHNSYQDTGIINISDDVAVRRMRNWRINSLRDQNDEGRLKDTYFILELTFNNEDNKLIRLDDIIINHFPIRPY